MSDKTVKDCDWASFQQTEELKMLTPPSKPKELTSIQKMAQCIYDWIFKDQITHKLIFWDRPTEHRADYLEFAEFLFTLAREDIITQLQTIPKMNFLRADRYDTDSSHVLHLWDENTGQSFDFIVPMRRDQCLARRQSGEKTMSDTYDNQVEALLPCTNTVGCWSIQNAHGVGCAATFRPAIAARLREDGEKIAALVGQVLTITHHDERTTTLYKTIDDLCAQLAEAREATASLICPQDSHTLGCQCACVVCLRRANWIAANREKS